VLWTVCNSVTDDVPWKRRNTRTLSYRHGTHRFRFRAVSPIRHLLGTNVFIKNQLWGHVQN
jgi:hypothetical protein